MSGPMGACLLDGGMSGTSGFQRDSTRVLLWRLWREHLRDHRPRMLLVLALTGVMAGTTALYPVVIKYAFQMFADRNPDIVVQIPVLVVIVTLTKAAAQYFQNVAVQKVIDAIVADEKAEIVQAVTDGKLTQAQADALQAKVVEHVTAIVNGERPAPLFGRGGHGGRGDHGGRGGHGHDGMGDDHSEADETSDA